MTMHISRRQVLLAATALLGSRAALAQSTQDKESEASLAAQGWLVLLDRKDWGRAWETAAAPFRNKVPLSTWMDQIPKLRDPLGALVERTQAEASYKTSLQGMPNGEYVTVVFASKFSSGEVTEVVTTEREPDGKWRVTGYRPPL